MSGFAVGQTVRLVQDGRSAEVKFVGGTDFAPGDWVGVELEDSKGKNDGSVNGVRYFSTSMGRGMFLRPAALTITAQPPAPAPLTRAASGRKSGRPSSLFSTASSRPSSVTDPSLNRRMSLNASSPSPVPKTLRTSSIARSPTKSPVKPYGPPSTGPSRTGTPSNSRVPSVGTKPRASSTTARTSMGPPPIPASKTRQTSISSVPSRASVVPGRSISGRVGFAGTRVVSRADSSRRPSADSQTGSHDAGSDGKDDAPSADSPPKSETEILSPQPTSPVLARSNTIERLTAAAAPETSTRSPNTTTAPRSAATTAPRGGAHSAAAREIEDLKSKIKILERKRIEDRDKLKQLEKVKMERDKFESIIQKLQTKYQPQQAELAELKMQMKEAEARFETLEKELDEQGSMLEIATLDKEVAEEQFELTGADLAATKLRVEELELELEIANEELKEFREGIPEEERRSVGFLQLERENHRCKEALRMLRDYSQEKEADLTDQIKSLEEDLAEFTAVKAQYEDSREKLAQADSAITNLQTQLDDALGAEDMIEELSNKNMTMSEEINELKAVIEDLESLKEINDELEINHVQNEKEMQEELDFKDTVIAEQARRASQQETSLEDMEYTLSRFRELVTSLQGDLEDIRASHAVTETESEQLNSRSRAMMDLNMKLQLSAAKAQVKAIDLELRRLEAEEAEQHLEIVTLFLPDSYKADRPSVLTLLRFRRLTFKANLVQSFIKERVNGQPHPGHEDEIFSGCDAIDKLTWVAAMCERFFNAMGHCTTEQFSRYENALHELEPVERALNGWVDGLRRDELKESKCASELQRTIALLSHLGEVHLSDDLASFADLTHMQTVHMQSHLESAAVSLLTIKSMVQRAVQTEGEDDEVANHFAKRAELAVSQTRSAKVLAAKAVRSLEDMKIRSLSLPPETRGPFEQCEEATQALAHLSSRMGLDLHALLHEEGRLETLTYTDVHAAMQKTIAAVASSTESDIFSTYLANLRVLSSQLTDLAALCADLDQAQEFDVAPAPWRLRAEELKALKTVPVDAEEELRRLREEHNEVRRAIAQRDETLSTANLKIETLESRMKDAHAKAARMAELEEQVEDTKRQSSSLKEDIEKQDRELKSLEADRDKWKKIASDSRAFADGAAGLKAGQERAVATAREMDALKNDISSLQAAVRYLREDNRRARMAEQSDYGWLAEPLRKPTPVAEQRKALVVAEGKDVLHELVKMAGSAQVYDLASMPQDKLAWRPARQTPQHQAARQAEDYAAWKAWQSSVIKKSQGLLGRRHDDAVAMKTGRSGIAHLQIRLPGVGGKAIHGSGRMVQIVGSNEWEAMQGSSTTVVV